MDTKYELAFSKPIEGSRWQHLVSIWFNYEYQDVSDKNPDITAVPYRNQRNRNLQTARSEFIAFMEEQYGPQDQRWSVRWSDWGADVRFDNSSDTASFLMLNTFKGPLNEMGEFYRKNSKHYHGIRGH